MTNDNVFQQLRDYKLKNIMAIINWNNLKLYLDRYLDSSYGDCKRNLLDIAFILIIEIYKRADEI